MASPIEAYIQESEVPAPNPVFEGSNIQWQYLSDVQSEAVEWLIEPYLPAGMVSLLAGKQGLGKTAILGAFAAMVTNGYGPSHIYKTKAPGKVVFVAKEDVFKYTVKPRLERLGADCSRIIGVDCESGANLMLDKDGIGEIRRCLEAVRPSLFIIDPIMSMINGKVNTKDQNAVREVLGQLPPLASEFGCNFLLAAHVNKSNDPDPMNRIMASADFSALPRTVLFAGRDPDDYDSLAVAHIKTNVGPHGKSLGFDIDKETGEFTWTGFSDLTGQRMCEPPAKKFAGKEPGDLTPKQLGCRDWLFSWLKMGPASAEATEQRAKEFGISRTTLYEVVRMENITKGYAPIAGGGHRGPAWWAMPGHDFSKFDFSKGGEG